MAKLVFESYNGNNGIEIEYVLEKNIFRISGWYNSIVGLFEPIEISLADFLMRLDVGQRELLGIGQAVRKGGTTLEIREAAKAKRAALDKENDLRV